MNDNPIKQVIVIRKDLKMRRGKEIAQGAHASGMFLVHHVKHNVPLSEPEKEWLFNRSITKITLQVTSEDELLNVHKAALEAGLNSHLITDSGRTEFGNIPTNTCIAIGPDYSDQINKITSHLSLY